MFLILNRANLIVCITSVAKRVKQQENGLVALAAEGETATAVYAADNDSFYPLSTPGAWGMETYRVAEVESVPGEVIPGYWYYTGEFFTTPEKEAELKKTKDAEAAALISGITFVTLAESEMIDEVTITEHPDLFVQWDEFWTGSRGAIVQWEGILYRAIHNISHPSENIKPSENAASVKWRRIGSPGEEWPEWSRPILPEDGYVMGDKVTHNSKKWVVSEVGGDGYNVWEPGQYGWTEYVE